MTTTEKALGPVTDQDRSGLLDALRGWALFGVLIANMRPFSGYSFLDDGERAVLLLGDLNKATNFLLEWLVIGKFYGLFSLLFGIGFAIQLGRLERRGEGAGRYLRRLTILFLFGLAHLLLLWVGDILALYALMGAVLLLFRRASDRALLSFAVALWLAPVFWAGMIEFFNFRPAAPLQHLARDMLAEVGVDRSHGRLPLLVDPNFALHFKAHPGEAVGRLALFIQEMRFTKVLGMFMLGLWVGRHALHVAPGSHRALLRRAASFGLTVGLPLAAVRAVLEVWFEQTPVVGFASELLYCLSTPILALGYAAAFTLFWLRHRRSLCELAAPAGRMALTNYLTQTLFLSVIFLGWGLGMIGKLGLVFVLPISIGIFAIQLAYSRAWLARFRFGPMEWLWRSATYGIFQPLRRVANAVSA